MKKIFFKLLVLTIVLVFSSNVLKAEGGDKKVEYLYLIKLKDKSLNYVRKDRPETYLTPKALDRRAKFNILIDSFDYPVSKSYIESIRTKGLKILYPTRWLNGIVVSTDDHDKARSCLMLFYVDKVYYLGKQNVSTKKSENSAVRSEENSEYHTGNNIQLQEDLKTAYANSYDQINMLNGIELHKNGYTGKGISIAVFDAGFYGVDKNPIFKNIGEQVIKTWDFVSSEQNVYDDDSHGAHVLSCIAASKENSMIGSAPDAMFYLFRTESSQHEYLYEEIHWIRAAEVADSLGVDLINSSLGYTYFDDRSMNHSWKDLGGNTWISLGAQIAASKGMLIVNAAGNEGTGKWKYINPPADVPEVLAVGAVQLDGSHVSFSSYGHPSLLGIKPDICAPGYAVSTASSTGKITHGNGTSYASPIVCGLAACLLQGNPGAMPKDIIEAVVNSADRRLNPDSAYGYGVPDFIIANAMLSNVPVSGFKNITTGSKVTSKNKAVLYVPDGEQYKVVFYSPGKFLLFNTKRDKVKVSGLILQNGHGIVDIPSQFDNTRVIGAKAIVLKEKGKVRVKELLKRQ